MLSASEVEWLLDTLCVDLGFCLPPAARKILIEHPPTGPDDFTDAVFVAEGSIPPQLTGSCIGRSARS
jgi:hypothetical protein